MIPNEYTDTLTYKLIPDVEEFLRQRDSLKGKIDSDYHERKLEEIRKALGSLRAFSFLGKELDFGILRNSILLRCSPNPLLLQRTLEDLGLGFTPLLRVFICLDTLTMALGEKALSIWLREGTPPVLNDFLDFLLRCGLETEITDDLFSAMRGEVMLGSKRCFVRDDIHYFLLLPYQYTIREGFLEPPISLGNILVGWSPTDA